MQGCKEGLELAIDYGIISPYKEMKLSPETRIIYDELKGISQNLKFLSTSNKASFKEIIEFEKSYRCQVEIRHSKITPPFVESIKTISIDDIYVLPSFIPASSLLLQNLDQLSTKDMLQSIYRTVILGNPGGGKSTFTSKVCFDLSKKYNENLFAGRSLTPVHVILRGYLRSATN